LGNTWTKAAWTETSARVLTSNVLGTVITNVGHGVPAAGAIVVSATGNVGKGTRVTVAVGVAV